MITEVILTKALYAAGQLGNINDETAFTINGHTEIVSGGTFVNMAHAVCKKHAIWFINNIGKAWLDLPARHASPRAHCVGVPAVTDDDVACTKSILRSLGSAVELRECHLLRSGELLRSNPPCKSLTLRIDDNLHVDDWRDPIADEKARLAALLNAAMSQLISRMFFVHEERLRKASKARKDEQRRAKQAEYRAAKKRRAAAATDDNAE